MNFIFTALGYVLALAVLLFLGTCPYTAIGM